MKTYLETIGILTPDEITSFCNEAIPRSIKKNEYFTREGAVCDYVAFVKSGLFRSYYLSTEGEEISYCITFPRNFIAAYSSYISLQPTPENIQAITNAELLVIPKKKVDELSAHSVTWQCFLRVMAEQEYIKLEKRIFFLQKEKALLRYKDLLQNYPEFLQYIPLQYLASYLGISQRHLSRLRKEISF